MKLSKLLKSLSCIALAVFLMSNTAVAGSYNGTGSGSQGGTNDSIYTWSTQKQGYRITIIDQSGNIVAEPVDILQSREPAEVVGYYTSKVETFGSRVKQNEIYYLSDILNSTSFDKNNPMPMAISWDNNNNAHGEGEALRKWLMAGEAAIRISSPTTSGNNHLPPTNNGSKENNSSTDKKNNSKQEEVTKQKPSEIVLRDAYIKRYKEELQSQISLFRISGYSNLEIRSGLWNYMLFQCSKLDSYSLISAESKKVIVVEMHKYAVQLQKQVKANHVEKNLTASNLVYDNSNVSILTDNNYTSSTKSTISLFDNLMPMIAYGAEEEKGYMKPLLQYSVNGEYIIRFKDMDNSINTGENRDVIIALNDYIVLIEPIVWFVPLDKNKKPYSKYVYGTITNHAQWSSEMNKKGWDDWGKGGYYGLVTTGTGATALKTDSKLVLGGKTITPPTDGNKSSRQNTLVANTSIGYALHSYKAEYAESSTHTFDSIIGNKPHPAPNPNSIPLADGENPVQRNINIVKTYELNSSHVGTYSRNMNPQMIEIQDEIDYKVEEWFISNDYVTTIESNTWAQIKNSTSISSSGKSATTVRVENADTTLYVKLTRTDKTNIEDKDPDKLQLEESEISKAFSQNSINEPRTHLVDYNGLSSSHNYYCSGCKTRDVKYCKGHKNDATGNIEYLNDDCATRPEPYCSGHTCTLSVTEQYKYNFKNFAPINISIQGDSIANFDAKHTRDKADTEGKGLLSGGTNTITSMNEEFIIHRGADKVTLASYNYISGSNILKPLVGNRTGLKPIEKRQTKNYTDKLKLDLQIDLLTSVLKTKVTHSGCGASPEYQTHTPQATKSISADVAIKVYQGKATQVGNETRVGNSAISISNMTGYMGKMVTGDKAIKFYPYVGMTYQTTQGYNTKTQVNVLSTYLREILPNDYAEFGWRTDNQATSLSISSTQWSMHKRATDGNDGWQGTNQVLPGGAIFDLTIQDNNRPFITINTWQTILYGPSRDAVSANVNLGDSYTFTKAEKEHKDYVDSVIKTLEGLSVVQWVNPNPKATNAWSAGGIKVNAGVSLTGLAGNKGSTDAKYYLTDDPTGTNVSAGEADLDVIRNASSAFYYKVYSDISGNILLDSGSDLDALSKSTGGEIVVTKGIAWADVNNSLSGLARQIDNRTFIITNYAKAIERNSGNDPTASWAPDGRWYNEAFNGIYLVYQTDKLHLGFTHSPTRSTVLDPNLTPKNVGVSDLFSKAYLSQFRLNEKSSATGVNVYGENYVGHFKGQPIYADDLKNMLQSRKFYIPNVNVQDLRN